MKKINPKILWLLGIVIVFLLVKSCDYFFDFEQKISHCSKDINQAKDNNIFVSNIKLEGLKFQSEPAPLKILKFNGWLEKTSTYQGSKIKKINEKSFSIVFDFELDKNSELNKKNYGKTWAIYYNKRNSIGSLTSSSNASITGNFEVAKDSINKPIKLRIKKFPAKFHPNDSENIGNLIIKAEK